jgi:UDP-N-acetylglucosamine 2-epimerase (non-hydrolysing)
MQKVIEIEKPSIILVQGDTTTTFAASLAAFYHKIKIGHVEAGLRTKNKYSPFPEEMNRTLVSCLADIHFAPTEWARENLLTEGIDPKNIFVTGNTVIDALLWILEKNSEVDLGVNLDNKKTILLTAHRRENFGRPLQNICEALKILIDGNSSIQIVYPVHPNPNIRDVVIKKLGEIDRIHLIEPLDYMHFVHLINRSYLILTDSGGIQEEAPSLGKPVLVLRNETERPEGIQAGTVKIVGTEIDRIVESVEKLLSDHTEYEKMAKASNPYGDGHSSDRIVSIVLSYFSSARG